MSQGTWTTNTRECIPQGLNRKAATEGKKKTKQRMSVKVRESIVRPEKRECSGRSAANHRDFVVLPRMGGVQKTRRRWTDYFARFTSTARKYQHVKHSVEEGLGGSDVRGLRCRSNSGPSFLQNKDQSSLSLGAYATQSEAHPKSEERR
ncbi:hypothetical protein BKA70DRAFT_1228084 [Coprinopsis sp. MPI-PUGE-AT-0042]|nr:hypothetical protein BKA70DRAFT_1228084 [Coprinopsis sp. MPI-PUGE-AT-0042]